MPGKICNNNNICVDAEYITTTWTVDQVQQVLTLSAVYAPYKIARIVRKRTFDTYQIVYHYDYFRQLITFLTTPRSKVICGNTEIPASFISTVWTCEQLSTAISLLLQGYGYETVARRVKKRTADVKAIRDHLSYFIDLLDQVKNYIQMFQGLLIYNAPDGRTFESQFEVPGVWTMDSLCACQNNQLCHDYIYKFHESNYLVVLYTYESYKGKIYTVDVFRGVAEWYGLANLIVIIALDTNPNIGVGLEQTQNPPVVTACKFNAIYQYITTSV